MKPIPKIPQEISPINPFVGPPSKTCVETLGGASYYTWPWRNIQTPRANTNRTSAIYLLTPPDRTSRLSPGAGTSKRLNIYLLLSPGVYHLGRHPSGTKTTYIYYAIKHFSFVNRSYQKQSKEHHRTCRNWTK